MGILSARSRSAQEDRHDHFEGYEVIAARMRVILPQSFFRTTWDWLLIVLVVYNLVSIPLEICFLPLENVTIPVPLRVFNIIVDTIFLVDIVLNFRTAFFESAGLSPVIEPKLIARHYLFGPSKRGVGWFWPDAIAAIPFDWFLPSSSASIAKLGRLFRLGRLIKKLDAFVSAKATRVFNVLLLLLLCTHFFGCIWWRIGMDTPNHQGWPFRTGVATVLLESDVSVSTQDPFLYYDDLEGDAVLNRTRLKELIDDVGIPKKYLTALYWALTCAICLARDLFALVPCATVYAICPPRRRQSSSRAHRAWHRVLAFASCLMPYAICTRARSMVMKSPWLAPSMGTEQLFACLTVVLGAMLFAMFIGNFTSAIASYDKSNAIYRDSISTLRHFFKMRPHLSAGTRRRAFRYHQAYFRQTIEGVPEETILASMPEHLRPSMLIELHSDLIQASPWLQETSFACCCDFLSALRPEILLRGDHLLRAGVVCRHFYILLAGEIKVSFPPGGNKLSKLATLLGEGSAKLQGASGGHRTSQRVPQGRIERMGSLIGWGPPNGIGVPLAYTANGGRDSSLLSISRTALGALLDAHPLEASIFKRASDHAAKLINPVKKNVDELNKDDTSKASRCSAADVLLEASGAGGGGRKSCAKARTTSETEDVSAMLAARDGGWLKTEAGGGLYSASRKDRPSGEAEELSSRDLLDAVQSATDEKLNAVLNELVRMRVAQAEQAAANAELRQLLTAITKGGPLTV